MLKHLSLPGHSITLKQPFWEKETFLAQLNENLWNSYISKDFRMKVSKSTLTHYHYSLIKSTPNLPHIIPAIHLVFCLSLLFPISSMQVKSYINLATPLHFTKWAVIHKSLLYLLIKLVSLNRCYQISSDICFRERHPTTKIKGYAASPEATSLVLWSQHSYKLKESEQIHKTRSSCCIMTLLLLASRGQSLLSVCILLFVSGFIGSGISGQGRNLKSVERLF